MADYPKIRDDKARFGITIQKKHKEHLEKVADSMGISLNSLFVMCALKEYPYKEKGEE